MQSTTSIPTPNNINSKDVNQNISIVPNQQSIKMEVLQFKDDVLKEIKLLKKSISEKFQSNTSLISEKFTTYDNKIMSLSERVIELSEKINSDNNAKNNISSLIEFKNKTRDHLLTMEIKINNIDKEMRNNIFRIDNILTDSVIYPGIIGKSCKFKTFHQMLDHVLSQISQNKTYREKNTLDLNTYKKKLESIVQNLQSQKDGIVQQNNNLINKKMDEIEEKFKSLISLYDERLSGTRAENSQYIKNMEETVNRFKNELIEFEKLKGKIFEEIKEEGAILRKENEKTQNIFLGYKREFNLLKDRFTQLSEFIKDVRFRINIGQEVKKRDFYLMSSKIDFSKKQKIENNNNEINITNNEENETNKELSELGEEKQNKENDNRKYGFFSHDNKNKGKNINLVNNHNKKSRTNTASDGKDRKKNNNENDNINNLNNKNNKIFEKNANINNLLPKDSNSKDNNFKEINEENKDKIKNEKEIDGNFLKKINTERRRSSITVKSIMGELNELNKFDELNNNEIKKEQNQNNNNNNTIKNQIFIQEKKDIQDLIEEKKNSDIDNLNKLNINYTNKAINNNKFSKNINFNSNNISNNKNNNNLNIKNEKLSHNNSQEDKNIINDLSKKNINTRNNQIKIFNGIINIKDNLKNESNINKEYLSKEKKIIIKNDENNKILNSPKDIFSTVNEYNSGNNYNNVIGSKKNSKIYSPPKSPKKIITRIQSAINNNLPNLNNNNSNSNYLNKKQQTIRPSSSANNLYKGRNLKNQRIIIDSSYKTPVSLSKTIILEEDKKIKNINYNSAKKNNNNDINSEIYFLPNYTQFRANKIKTNINPNVQALQHGVQQLYENSFFDKQSQIGNLNKKNLGIENIKKSSLNKTNYYKQNKLYNRNIEAREIQGMIYNLQGYIKGYDSNFMSQNELREEKKKFSKNSSYYKLKEIVNENRKNNIDISSNKNKRNFVEIGFNNYK